MHCPRDQRETVHTAYRAQATQGYLERAETTTGVNTRAKLNINKDLSEDRACLRHSHNAILE